MTHNSQLASRSSPLRTVSIGGATFDLFLKTDTSVIHRCGDLTGFALPLGSKIRVKDVTSTCGGGANNTAVGLSRLGCDAAFAGVIASDQWGQILLKNLGDEGVDTSHLTIVEDETSSFSIILSADSGERVILYEPGTNKHLHDVTFDREAVAGADVVFLNHIHQDSGVIQDDIVHALVHAPNIHLSWNPGGCQIEVGLNDKNNALLMSHTDLLLVNKEEALAFSGQKTVHDAMRTFIHAGAKHVIVTDGKNGSQGTDGTMLWHCNSPAIAIVDTTGAGDAFGCAATWAMINGKGLPIALKAGTINAMSVVGMTGAQPGLLTQTQLTSRLAESTIETASETF